MYDKFCVFWGDKVGNFVIRIADYKFKNLWIELLWAIISIIFIIIPYDITCILFGMPKWLWLIFVQKRSLSSLIKELKEEVDN